jgi:cytoskeletal protein RodZ
MSADRPSGDFGGTLRAARERRGVSLRQIANATKISVAVLEALERNDISRLPGGIFVRAFVRSYAIEVGLDPEEAIQDFIAQFPADSVTAGHPASAQIEDHESHESDRRMATTFVRLIAISVPVAAAVVYFGLSGRQGLQTEVAPAAAAATPAAAPPPAEPPAASPAPVSPAVVPVTPTTGSAETAATSATPATAAPGPAVAASPAPAAADDSVTVGLTVTRPCFVTATVDGKRTINRLLEPGEKHSVEIRKELLLLVGDAAGIRMTLNGVEAKPLGKAGDPATVRLTPASFKSYLPNP